MSTSNEEDQYYDAISNTDNDDGNIRIDREETNYAGTNYFYICN
jgi:hypothetical protein